jgi:hypothetical protein
VILRVDTHNDVHVAAVLTPLGALLDTRAFPTTAAGYASMLDWATRHGVVNEAGVEDTSSRHRIEPLPAPPCREGDRGQPARPGRAAPTRQDRRDRRREHRPYRAFRAHHGSGEVR